MLNDSRHYFYAPAMVSTRTILLAGFICACAAGCTSLPPASMPEPAVERPNTLSFVGNRDEAARIAVGALEDLGLSVKTIDADAGFIGASNGVNQKSWGERIGVQDRESSDA